MRAVLELRSLTKEFANHRALDNVSLEVAEGEFFSLVGPSGCGKTTTLRIIAGFEDPSRGEVLLNGDSLLSIPAHRRDVSTVFQNYALFPHLTVHQNIAFGLERRRVNTQSIANKVKQALDLVQLTGKESRLPNQISGGERQRVALARSLVLEPRVLLLDEPLSALDPQLRKQMRTELKTLQKRVGITFLFITHDQEEALSMSDRIAVMHKGRIEQTGTGRELYAEPLTRFVAEFLGPLNWIQGAAIRPESLSLCNHRGQDRSAEATVEQVAFMGSRVHVETCLADGSKCTVEARDGTFTPGEAVRIFWNAADELPVKRA